MLLSEFWGGMLFYNTFTKVRISPSEVMNIIFIYYAIFEFQIYLAKSFKSNSKNENLDF